MKAPCAAPRVAVLERRAHAAARPMRRRLMSAPAGAGGGARRRRPLHLRQPRRRAVPRRLGRAARRMIRLTDLLPADNPVFLLIAPGAPRRGHASPNTT